MGSIEVTVTAADRDRALRRALRDDSKVQMHLSASVPVTSPVTSAPAAPVLLTAVGRRPQTIEVSAADRARALRRALRDDTRVKVTL